MRHLVILLFLAAITAGAWSDELPAFGTLAGSVKMENGDPLPNLTVNVTVEAVPPPAPYTFTTNAKGEFAGLVRIGKAHVTAEGVTKDVVVTDDANGARVEIVIGQDGIIIVVAGQDNVTLQNPQAMIRTTNGMDYVPVRTLGTNRYWIRPLPANATDFALRALLNYAFIQSRWKLEGEKKFYQFTYTPPKPVRLEITVLDANDKPVPQMQYRGSLACQTPVGDEEFNFSRNMGNNNDFFNMTDTAGKIPLLVAPGRYALRLFNPQGRAGRPLAITVPDDKPFIAVSYSNGKNTARTVTQTVFTVDNKPAPGAKVSAVFLQQDNIVRRDATANAEGQVVWENLPSVKTIVWGAGILPGVMQGDETLITAPLPPVIPERNMYRSFRVKCENLPPDMTRVVAAYVSGGNENNNYTNAQNGGILQISGNPGAKFSLLVLADGAMPRIGAIDDLYFPYFDDDNGNPQLTVSLTDCAIVKCGFTTEDGTPVPALSRLGILPLKPVRAISGLLNNNMVKEAGLCLPLAEAGGKYRIALPAAGQYRLLVDLYDSAVKPLPQLLITAKEGVSEMTIKLPPPLATVPGGAVISWLTACAPGVSRQLTAAASADQMPIFGPREDLLCLWYRPAPNRLAVLSPDAQGLHRQELSLRTLRLKSADPDATNGGNRWFLHALFPASRYGYGRGADDRPSETEINTVSIPRDNYEVNIWNSTYLTSRNNAAPFSPLTVPAAGPVEIAVKLPDPQQSAMMRRDEDYIGLRFIFPPFEYEKARNTRNGYGRNMISYTCDVLGNQNMSDQIDPISLGRNNGNERNVTVPRKAGKISFYWPGYGTITDVALPAHADGNDGEAPITLPAWTDGVSVSGTLLNTDGTPLAKKAFQVMVKSPGQSRYGDRASVILTTDDAGKFVIKGLPQGVIEVYPNTPNEGFNSDIGGWAYSVPADGLRNLVLRKTDNPVQLNWRTGRQQDQMLWWLLEDGAPQPLPISGMYGQQRLYQPLVGTGYLWSISPDGRGFLERMTLPAGNSISLTDDGNTTTSPLGLYLPLNPATNPPQRISLCGQGSRAGLSVDFVNLRWQPVALLDSLVTQIDAVPPGKWLLRVRSDGKITEYPVEIGETGAAVHLKP